MEKNYPADDSKRVLMGSSLGGLFTIYAMLTEPSLFFGYVAASPAARYGQRFLVTQESEYASKRKDLPVKLFVSVGEVENLAAPVKELVGVFKGRGYEKLQLESRVIEGERHAGNKPAAFNRGLRFVFQK